MEEVRTIREILLFPEFLDSGFTIQDLILANDMGDIIPTTHIKKQTFNTSTGTETKYILYNKKPKEGLPLYMSDEYNIATVTESLYSGERIKHHTCHFTTCVKFRDPYKKGEETLEKLIIELNPKTKKFIINFTYDEKVNELLEEFSDYNILYGILGEKRCSFLFPCC